MKEQEGKIVKKIAKKNQIVIATLAVMIAAAGYMNYSGKLFPGKTKTQETNSELQGVTDGTLLYNIRYLDNGNDTTTLYATIYQKGKDVTKNYPDKWFTWRRKTESGEYYLGYGYQITVQNKDYEFGGACADTYNLTTKSGKYLTTRSGKQITIWREN